MKFALIALVATVAAYDVSEGPTKVDLGESDDQVTIREFDTGNGVKFSGWNNPLAWTDDGTDDEDVLPMLSSSIRRRHHHHKRSPKQKNVKDAYDHDPTTVSEYDDMKHHQHKDYTEGVPEFEGAMLLVNLRAPKGKKDNFDNDPNTVSEYDAMRMGPHGPVELQ